MSTHLHSVDRREAIAAAATARCRAIIDSVEASGREELAKHLAFSTSMPAAEAITLLAKAPAGSRETPAQQLESIALADEMVLYGNAIADAVRTPR